MRKNMLKNQGLPLSVNQRTDLTAKKGASFDSWYIIASVECDGEDLAFCWHHQIICPGPVTVTTVECLLMNATKNISYNEAMTVPSSSENGASEDELNVYSKWAVLKGDRDNMTFKMEVPHGKVDIKIKCGSDVLYNGTTGLLHFIGEDSHEFAFPNMQIEGTLTLDGKEYTIKNTKAWFDRQWGFDVSKTETVGNFQSGLFRLSWIWLGLPLGDGEAVSLWDAYQKDGRHAFATFMFKDGNQANYNADITYDNIFTSEKSGNSYPRKVHVVIPEQELDITIEQMMENPEYIREGGAMCGCQGLCLITGKYKGKEVYYKQIVEMIEDVCGEAVTD